MAALLALASCTTPRTELVVTVRTDLVWGTGGDLQSLRVTVRGGDSNGPLRLARGNTLGDGGWSLPMSFGLYPADPDGATPLWIEVAACTTPDADACALESALVVQRAVVRYRPQQTAGIDLWLGALCRNTRCMSNERCVRETGLCESAILADLGVRPWSTGGSRDASAPDAAGADAPTADASAPDATGADALTADASASDATGADALTADASAPDAPDAGAVADAPDGAVLDVTVPDAPGDVPPPDAADGRVPDVRDDLPAEDVPPCPPAAFCGGACVDSSTDGMHCGSCGHACRADQRCSRGLCGCPAGGVDCGGVCRDLSADVANCGACGVRCAVGQACRGGCVAAQQSCRAGPLPGCGLVEVVGGTFTMGAAGCSGSPDAACAYLAAPPQAGVMVGAFALDAYEVTVARFNAFWAARARDLAAVRSAPIAYPGGRVIVWEPAPNPEPLRQDSSAYRDCNWLPTPSPRDGHPMNCVDWWMAQEFCVWDGGRLPTEAEWEFAARGRAVSGLAAGRVYPWGNEMPVGQTYPTPVPCDRAQWYECPGDDGAYTRRVGSFADSAGAFDLAGNVEEWAADWYAPYISMSCWGASSVANPLCADHGEGFRVIRGGSWGYAYELSVRAAGLRSASRTHDSPEDRKSVLGFRCARTRP